MLDEGVELFARFSVFVSSSGDSDSDSSGKISNTLAPDELVESLVNSDILMKLVKRKLNILNQKIKEKGKNITFVSIFFLAKATISLIALGALFLKATLWILLWRLMV